VAALAEREVERHYIALCTGVMTAGGTVDEPIGRHRSQRTRMAVRSDGRPAVTHYRVLKRFRSHTMVRAELETGRTHQIRVHLSAIGHPIVGDSLYGGVRRHVFADVQAVKRLERPFLHAARLAFDHPADHRRMEFEAELPSDLQQVLDALLMEQEKTER